MISPSSSSASAAASPRLLQPLLIVSTRSAPVRPPLLHIAPSSAPRAPPKRRSRALPQRRPHDSFSSSTSLTSSGTSSGLLRPRSNLELHLICCLSSTLDRRPLHSLLLRHRQSLQCSSRCCCLLSSSSLQKPTSGRPTSMVAASPRHPPWPPICRLRCPASSTSSRPRRRTSRSSRSCSALLQPNSVPPWSCPLLSLRARSRERKERAAAAPVSHQASSSHEPSSPAMMAFASPLGGATLFQL